MEVLKPPMVLEPLVAASELMPAPVPTIPCQSGYRDRCHCQDHDSQDHLSDHTSTANAYLQFFRRSD